MKLINRIKVLSFTVVLALFTASCTEEEKIPTYELSGMVKNTTLQGVNSAQVELVKNDAVLYSVESENNGSYSLVAEEGEYTLRITATGYSTYTETVNIVADSEVNATLLGTANVSGRILNSQTGEGLPNATIKLNRLEGQKLVDDTWEIIVFTDNDGYYAIVNGPTGIFTGLISAEGFVDRVITSLEFITGYNDIDDETIVSPPAEGELRVVLNWGEAPSDLDSHITGPNEYGGRFHVYYSNMSEGGVSLDVDDVSSFGPETITIGSFFAGTYRYSVHNYSNQNVDGGMGIYNSPARVEIYDHNGLLQSFMAPVFQSTDIGNTWRVFEIDFADGVASIRSINSYVYANSSSDTEIFKNQAKEKVKLRSKDF